MNKDLVSIIMLSRNSSQFVEDSVRSIFAQTYTNWELIFVDDNSQDNTIEKMMELRDEDSRIVIFQAVYDRGASVNRNAALKDVRGRWVAFLDAGDIWEPTKLEKQVLFMEEHDYAFSYTKFDNVDAHGRSLGVVMSGPERITYYELQKCCWLGYLTVMYDREKIGLLQVNGMEKANDYALWLQVAEKTDCYLLPECLATYMSEKGLYHRLITSPKLKWRYEAYRKIERMNPITATYMTIRNLAYTAYKWWKYAKKMK